MQHRVKQLALFQASRPECREFEPGLMPLRQPFKVDFFRNIASFLREPFGQYSRATQVTCRKNSLKQIELYLHSINEAGLV